MTAIAMPPARAPRGHGRHVRSEDATLSAELEARVTEILARRPAVGLSVIHQPVILAVAFWVVGWPAGIVVKWLAVFAISLPVTLILVELALRTPITRTLLGTRVRRHAAAEPATVSFGPAAVLPPR